MKFPTITSTVIVGLMMTTGATGAHAAFDVCKNVKFQIVNKRPTTIRITSFDYFRDVAANNPKHEDINPDLICGPGATCTTNGDDLADSEGENLSGFVFIFNDQEKDKGWSKIDVKTQPKDPDIKKCTANRTYGNSNTNPWTIN